MDTNQMYDVLDLTLKTLYENMDKGGLHLENDILQPNKIKLKPEETGKVWDVLMATGLADGIIGFGNSGKVDITPAGIQMMTRYGSYKNFLVAQQAAVQPQPQLTIQLAQDDGKAPKKAAGKSVPKPVKKALPAKKEARSKK